MIVYRISKLEEIKKILSNKSLEGIGKYFEESSKLSTHKYLNKPYLHFFHNLDSIFYLRTLKDRYLCIYDIPEEVLEKNVGLGYYLDYFSLRGKRKVKEYAISIEDLEYEYLKEINYIKEFIDLDNYFYYNDLNEKMLTIYKKKDHKKLTLKHKEY